MVIFLLVQVLILFLCANLFRNGAIWIVLSLIMFFGFWWLGAMFPPVVLFSALLLVVGEIDAPLPGTPRRLYFRLSCAAAVVVAFAIPAVWAWRDAVQVTDLLSRYPEISIEDRLPVRAPIRASYPLPEAAQKRVLELENRITLDEGGRHYSLVLLSLMRDRHHTQVERFINGTGFGFGRLMRPREASLALGLRDDVSIPQPNVISKVVSDDPGQGGEKWERTSNVPRFYRPNSDAVADFVYAAGLGLFVDRSHVTGFQTHRFSEVPKPIDEWTVETLDLVGLVMHEEPVAYVSENLPRMDELRTATTRGLDEFETTGLAELRRGEDVVVSTSGSRLRMFGPIRNVEQCVKCHGGERGDLLGAFSYRFGRTAE
jgi:hypothetical protein